jgi:hypothetical protein
VAYFRKRTVQAFGSHYVGVPEAAPLEIRLRLPRGRYSARLLNLNAAKLETLPVDASHVFKISPNTSDDYVLVVNGSRVRLEL